VALEKVRRNLDLLRRQFIPSEKGSPLSSQVPEEEIPPHVVRSFTYKSKIFPWKKWKLTKVWHRYYYTYMENDKVIDHREISTEEFSQKISAFREAARAGVGTIEEYTKYSPVEMKGSEEIRWFSPNEVWEEMETFLRKHGYRITREQFEHIIPIHRSFQATRERFHSTVAFYIHEAVEIEEISRKIGRLPSPWEHAPLVSEYPETHVKAHEMYKLYLKEKGVELPPAFWEERSRFQIPPEKMRVKHNPSFDIERFEEEKYKDFRWWYNRIYPQIRGKDWVDIETLSVEGATQDEIKGAIREGAGLGMWFYMGESLHGMEMLNISMSSTLELKNRFGTELRELISEAEGQKREIGAMLCRTAAGQPHLSRACYGRRETVTVADCHDGLSPLGSFHVHLGGTDVFSVPDLELAVKKEQLSCLGYTKGGHPYLKCVMPKRYYELPYETRTSIGRSLDQARQDIERANQLFRSSPSNPEALELSQRAQTTLRQVENLLGSQEVPL